MQNQPIGGSPFFLKSVIKGRKKPADVWDVAERCKDELVRVEPENLPPAGKLVIVLCWKENTIGYRDEQGRWRHALYHKELNGVVGWCALSAKGW